MMKKTAFLLVVNILFLAFVSFGQNNNAANFAPDGAQWWKDNPSFWGARGNYFFTAREINYSFVAGDTIINGDSAKIIRQRIYDRYDIQSSPRSISVTTDTGATLYVYNTQDTIFVYNKNFNRFTPLYVFNVNEGDTVCLPVLGDDLRPNPYANGEACFCFIIDSIRTVLYDTVYLTTYFEHSITGASFPNDDWGYFPIENWHYDLTLNTPTGAYARKIGSLFGGLLPIDVEQGASRPTIDSFAYPDVAGLRCYQEQGMAIHLQYSNSFGCLFDTTERNSIYDIQSVEPIVQLYPNPTSGIIHISRQLPFPQKTAISLIDNRGRHIKSLPSPAEKTSANYNLKDVASGVYFLKIKINNRVQKEKLVIRR